MIVPFAGLTAPLGWLTCDGSAVSRSTYANLFAALVSTLTGAVTSVPSGGNVSFTVTVASTTNLTPGMKVGLPLSGGGIHVTTVASLSPTQITTASEPVTTETNNVLTGSQSVQLTAWGLGDGSTTFNLPNLSGKFLMAADFFGTNPGTTGGAGTHTHPLSDNGQAEIVVLNSGSAVSRRVNTTASWTADHIVTGSGGTVGTVESIGAALTGATDSASSLPPYVGMRYIIKF
jgi:microcystin-dependent protein